MDSFQIKPVSNIYINNEVIERADSTQFLGVNLDSKMSWTNHINNVRSKLAKSIGLIYKARKVFYPKTSITLYYSFLYPHLSYCVQIWGSACHSHILSLIKLQKRAVRIIKSAPYRAHTEPLFQELNILPFHKIFQYSVIIFMFKCFNNMLPPLFAQLYLKNCDLHEIQIS